MATIYQRTYTRKDGTTYKRWCGEVNHNYKRKSFTAKTRKEVEKKIRDYELELDIYGNSLSDSSNNYIQLGKYLSIYKCFISCISYYFREI